MRGVLDSIRIIAVLMSMAVGVAAAQNGAGQLEPLVSTSARRLALAEQVALSKWDSGAAVEDAPREAQVILGAVKLGEAKGIDATSTTKFFKAQIEANKLIQYSMLAAWRRGGRVPAHAPIDLAGVIRPELDRLQTELIAELAATEQERRAEKCRVDIAAAVGKYVAAHRRETSTLIEIALDRAMSESCVGPTSEMTR